MMRPWLYRLGAVLMAGLALTAGGAPLASLLSSGTVQFNGARMIAVGVYSWPVLPGDLVATEGQPATILFEDKSRIFLDRDTRIRVSREDKSILVTIEKGSLRYVRMQESALRIGSAEGVGSDALCGGVVIQSGKASWSSGCTATESRDRATPPIPLSLGRHRPQSQ